jgi:hypothetical protein
MNPDTRRTVWIVASVFASILLIAGMLHLAYRMSAALYLTLRETDEKQTRFIFQLEKRMDEVERKLAVFEANLKYEAQRAQEGKPK